MRQEWKLTILIYKVNLILNCIQPYMCQVPTFIILRNTAISENMWHVLELYINYVDEKYFEGIFPYFFSHSVYIIYSQKKKHLWQCKMAACHFKINKLLHGALC